MNGDRDALIPGGSLADFFELRDGVHRRFRLAGGIDVTSLDNLLEEAAASFVQVSRIDLVNGIGERLVERDKRDSPGAKVLQDGVQHECVKRTDMDQEDVRDVVAEQQFRQ